MKKIFAFLCFCLYPLIVSAQINESDSLDLKADLSLTGAWQTGNVQTFIFRTRSDVSYRPFDHWVYKTTNSYVYQAFGGQKADEDILSLNFLYLNPQKEIYPLLLGFVSTNYRREIDLRYLLGAGTTFQILQEDSYWLKVSLSSEYERTNFGRARFNRSEYNGDPTINTIRGTIWVSGKYELFDKKMILKHESYYQPSLQEANNYRWQADLSLELPVWRYLNFKVNYIQTYESIVIETQKQEDRFLTFGFSLKNY